MSPISKALKAIGMNANDYNLANFERLAGKKAAAALRRMGYEKRGFTKMGGGRMVTWAKIDGAKTGPLTTEPQTAFYCLVVAIANEW